jgi:hypothetical protein
VANGSIDASYYIQAIAGSASGPATLTATAQGFTSATATVNIVQPVLAISGLATSMFSMSANDDFTVQIGALVNGSFSSQSIRAGGVPVAVTVTTSAPSVGRLITSLTQGNSADLVIAAGTSTTPSTLAAGGVQFDPLTTGASVISAASASAASANTVTVNINGQGISLLTTSITVGAGLQDGSYTARLAVSTHGGTTVRIQSSDPTRVLIAPNSSTPGAPYIDVPVANGSIDASYWVQGLEGAAGSTVTVTASAAGFTSGTGTVTVAAPYVGITGLASSMSASAADDAFQVQVGIRSNGSLSTQSVRAGAAPLPVTVTSTNAAVGTLGTSAGKTSPASVAIQPGQSTTPTAIASGGIVFDPLAAGVTSVSATANQFSTHNTVVVTVNP